jgi:Fe-S cluster assembly protein SufD
MSVAFESLLQLRQSSQSELRSGDDAGDRVAWIDSLRREAFASFKEQGIPTRRREEWKGTNFAPLSEMEFTRVGRNGQTDDVASKMEDHNLDGAPTLVFIDGEFDPSASRLTNLPAGVRALSLAEVLTSEPELLEDRLAVLTDLKIQPLVALQTAFLADGAVITVDRDVRVDQPIRLRFISTGDDLVNGKDIEGAGDACSNSAAFPRLLVIAEKRSSLTLLQEHLSAGPAPGFTAYVAEFHLAEGSRVEALEVQSEDATRIHFTSVHARLEQNASLDSHVISVGNGLLRSELAVTLAEPDAETKLCGLFLGRDSAHLDHFTTVDHAAERCTSDEEYRGVLADESKGVFRGRVMVRPGAQKTDAKQSNANLLLSDRATIDTKPQLEIYADDIKASHGSTIGQLDADALFFLRARGIDGEAAKRLLTGAFAQGVIARIKNEDLRSVATTHVDAALYALTEQAERVGS